VKKKIPSFHTKPSSKELMKISQKFGTKDFKAILD